MKRRPYGVNLDDGLALASDEEFGLPCVNARPAYPGFLIHDSTIFDGVDERQRAEALEIAASEYKWAA